MAGGFSIACDYCGHEGPVPEVVAPAPEHSSADWCCVDGEACDARDQAAHDARKRELRRVQRSGEPLTPAERAELAE